MVHFVALLQAAQDRDRLGHARLVDEDGLEAALEGRVLLDVLAVLVERGRANQVQLAAGQERLEHVARIHGALGRAGADDGVQLIDEQDHLPGGVGHFLEHGLEPLLELAAILGAGHERAEVERHEALVLQALGHVAVDDALRQAFGDGGLTDAWLADQGRVVLGAPRQDLDHAPDLFVAPDDGIELALAGQLGQVAPVLLERGVGVFGVLRRDAMRAADGGQRLEDGVAAHAVAAGQGAHRRLQRKQDVLGGDVGVLHVRRLALGRVEHVAGGSRQADGRVRSMLSRARSELLFGGRQQGCRRAADPVNDLRHDAVALAEQGDEQMVWFDLDVAEGLGQLLGIQDGFLGFLGEFLEVHTDSCAGRLPCHLLAPTPYLNGQVSEER